MTDSDENKRSPRWGPEDPVEPPVTPESSVPSDTADPADPADDAGEEPDQPVSYDPNGLPELSDLPGMQDLPATGGGVTEAGAAEADALGSGAGATGSGAGATGSGTGALGAGALGAGAPSGSRPAPRGAFLDEVDFSADRFAERRALESALEQRRRARRERRRREQRDMLWNALTVIVWLGMAFSVMAFVSIYTNSQSRLNPFRRVEPTLVSAVVLPSATPTPLPSPTSVVPDTPVPTATPEPPTATPQPTLAPTETPIPGPSPTPTIYSLYPFIPRGDVKVIASSTFPDHEACKLWVAGQVYDLQGAPMTGVTVMLGGSLNYKTLTSLSLTGTALQFGPAGYEFVLADAPVKSKQAVWVMLFNQSMVPLSGKVYFDTVDDCQQNLILINFRQVR